MVGEFEIQTRKMTDDKTSDKIGKMINLAAKEFPCLSCPSNAECATFAWFVKWFGKQPDNCV
jgi:hypothetical protein